MMSPTELKMQPTIHLQLAQKNLNSYLVINLNNFYFVTKVTLLFTVFIKIDLQNEKTWMR
jgi:hypothetical protein